MRSLAFAAFLCAALAPALAAAQSYPLQCRGGGMPGIGLQVFPNGENRLTVGFKHGMKPAAQGLAPGECAWLDRGMRADEPKSLCDDVTDAFLSTTGTDHSSFNPSHILLVQSAWSNDAPYLKGLKVQSSSNDATRRHRDLADIQALLRSAEVDLERVGAMSRTAREELESLREDGLSAARRVEFEASRDATRPWDRAHPADLEAILAWIDELRGLSGDPPVDRSPWLGEDFRL